MKKLLTILVLIMLIISFFQITSMYALYKEQIHSEYNTLLGAWEIKINSTDVTTSGQVETFTIANNQLGYVSSDYIQAGKIAPNGQAYFDIVIDPSNTDVSVVYTLDLDTKATSNTNTDIELSNAIELVKIENYFGQGNDGQTNKTDTITVPDNGGNNEVVASTTGNKMFKNGNLYTSVIPIEKITQGYKNYIRVYFRWNNVTTTTEIEGVSTEVETNNELDTELGETQNATIAIPIEINLKQYTGEVIGNGS